MSGANPMKRSAAYARGREAPSMRSTHAATTIVSSPITSSSMRNQLKYVSW